MAIDSYEEDALLFTAKSTGTCFAEKRLMILGRKMGNKLTCGKQLCAQMFKEKEQEVC